MLELKLKRKKPIQKFNKKQTLKDKISKKKNKPIKKIKGQKNHQPGHSGLAWMAKNI